MSPDGSNPTSPAAQNEDAGGGNFGECLARIEAGMAFMATREDIALARREIVGVKAELRTSIAGLKTLISERGASMQRWLLGITSAALASAVMALVRFFV